MPGCMISSRTDGRRTGRWPRLLLAVMLWCVAFAHDGRLATAAWAAGGEGIGPGLRLIMVDDVGCIYCRKWDAEVGGIYERSPVGAVAPLERRQKRHRDLAPYEPLAYTPTFVLVRDLKEVGRIVGYPGADFFWAELERLLAKAGPLPAPAPGDAPVSPRDASYPPPQTRAAARRVAVVDRSRQGRAEVRIDVLRLVLPPHRR